MSHHIIIYVSLLCFLDFFMFLKEVSSAHQGCIHLIKKYSRNSELLLQLKSIILLLFSV